MIGASPVQGRGRRIFDPVAPARPEIGREDDRVSGIDLHTVLRRAGGGACGLLQAVRRRTLRTRACLPALRREGHMTLAELSASYEAAAVPLRARLRLLRQQLAAAQDAEEVFHLKRRIQELTPMLTQMNELAELTAHYYDRGYWRNEKYTL